MKITAETLAKKPAQAYREADKGNTVTINNDRYPDKVFELTARERRTSTEKCYVDPTSSIASHKMQAKAIGLAKLASKQAHDSTSVDS